MDANTHWIRLTQFEKQQAKSTFINTGRTSYHALIHIDDNPYREEPHRNWWAEGWRLARRIWNAKRYSQQKARYEKSEKSTTPNATRSASDLLRRGLASGTFRRDGNKNGRNHSSNRPQGKSNAASYRAAFPRAGGK